MKYEVSVMHGEEKLGSFVTDLESDNPQAIIAMAQDGVTGMINETTKRGIDVDLNLIRIDIQEIK